MEGGQEWYAVIRSSLEHVDGTTQQLTKTHTLRISSNFQHYLMKGTKVILNVYDLSPANQYLSPVGLGLNRKYRLSHMYAVVMYKHAIIFLYTCIYFY